MLSSESCAAQMAAAVAVAMHGLKAGCECALVRSHLAAGWLAGAQPSAGAPPFVAVGSRRADEMQPAPRPVDRERAAVAGSALDQPTAVAAAVMGARLPHSGLQVKVSTLSLQVRKDAYRSALLYVPAASV